MPITQGQILPDSPLGYALKTLAFDAKTIVEIGTGSGLGSTQCLLAGACVDGQIIHCVEGDFEQFKIALQNLSIDLNLYLWHGVLHHTIAPYFHPLNRVQDQEMWISENELIKSHPPCVLGKLPEKIDLLLLDGGEFTSDGDFLAFWERARTIVIDDCNPEVARKNAYALESMSKATTQWENDFRFPLKDTLNDRNGWAVFQRKK